MTNSTQPIALISGANQGIGLAVSHLLATQHNFHVLIGSRSLSAGQTAAQSITSTSTSAGAGGQHSATVTAVQLDITSDESISAAVTFITEKFGKLDVLINNAGVLLDHDGLLPRDLFTRTFSTNVTGAACLTEAMLPLLRASPLPRVIFVSSRMGSLTESLNKSTIYYHIDYKAYDCSKAALNMLALNYARVLEKQGGLVNVVCPGLVKTKMSGFHEYGSSTEVGATRIVELAVSGEGGETGTFSDRDGVIAW